MRPGLTPVSTRVRRNNLPNFYGFTTSTRNGAMKIGQTTRLEDESLLFKTTHTATPALTKAQFLRDMGKDQVRGQENVPVAVVPAALVFEWAKKHGVKFDDPHAMADVVDRELANPDNAMFRVFRGTY